MVVSATMDKTHQFEVDEESTGQRLDSWLTERLEGVSRARVGRAIELELVEINGQTPRKAGVKLRAGDLLSITVAPPEPLRAVPQDIPVEIMHLDSKVVVVSKPAGMVVHPSAGHHDGTLVNALLYHVGKLSDGSAPERPGIVHRLDRDTTGVLVVARDPTTHTHLAAQFAAHTVTRRYLCVVHGSKIEDEGTIETLYNRHVRNRMKMSGRVAEGKRACTHWKTLARSRGFALVECRLETGRTHQIRVHLAEAGHPVISDELYGTRPATDAGPLSAENAAARRMPRQALHARTLAFDHPSEDARPSFTSALPEDIRTLIASLFGETIAEEFDV
jgi:23S rRNA pseudouridine1911/1915/1917 synthase